MTLLEGTPEDVKAFEDPRQEFARYKSAAVQTTPYGLLYSPHYARQSHDRKS